MKKKLFISVDISKKTESNHDKYFKEVMVNAEKNRNPNEKLTE